MAQARGWLKGLIPLALLWLAAVLLDTSAVETDLMTRVGTTLSSGPWMPGSIVVHGRDVTLGGEAYDERDRAAALVATNATHGVRLVADDSKLVAEANPYVWSASKGSSGVTLDGDVPKPVDRTKIFATAGAGGTPVIDQATYARGAPEGFTAAAARLALVLGTLESGKVALDGAQVSATGLARDKASRDAAVAALGQLPAAFAVAKRDIGVPAYVFTATQEPAKGTVTFAGALPDTRSREAILAAARKMFVGVDLVDRTKLQAGAPDGFAGSVTAGLEQLARLDGGTLSVTDKTVELKGNALYARAVDQIAGALGALPPGFSAKSEVTAKPSGASIDQAACQQRFDELLKKGTVLFETGSAKIDKVSAGILDRLVAIADECPGQSLEVSGHTDAAGNDAFNMDLSKKRAEAVVAYLAAAGLDASHLSAVGYGKTKPIASNDTEDGRAKNRRIEFLVK